MIFSPSTLTVHKPSLGSCEVPFGLDRFSRFDDYQLQTNRQNINLKSKASISSTFLLMIFAI